MGVQGVETGIQGGKFYEKGAEMGETGGFSGKEASEADFPSEETAAAGTKQRFTAATCR